MTPGPDIVAGPRSSGEVALTFHGAGDPSIARAVLAALAAHQAEVTVFTVGTWARQHPDVVHALLGAGHDVGNHTWSHQPMRSLSAAAARVEVQRGAHAVAAVRGSAGALFRPSGTPTSTATIRAAAASAGYHRCISYDVDSLDYTDPGSTAIVRNVEATVRGGSIVSLHLGHPGTVAALPKILDLLTQRGLRAVTITRLLAHPGEPVLARS
ncbi:polysaccharide deacetylase family protein [Allobranchiibius sp. CTAmp26]|nr:polysaccharide deacetylase family protein [Allobranchiibius sp. CTAmp26]